MAARVVLGQTVFLQGLCFAVAAVAAQAVNLIRFLAVAVAVFFKATPAHLGLESRREQHHLVVKVERREAQASPVRITERAVGAQAVLLGRQVHQAGLLYWQPVAVDRAADWRQQALYF